MLITCIHNYHEIRSLLRLSWALARSLSFRDKTIISLQVLNQFSWLKHRFNVFFSESGHGALGFSIRKEKIRFYVFSQNPETIYCSHGTSLMLPNAFFAHNLCSFIKTKRCLKMVNIEITKPSKRVYCTILYESHNCIIYSWKIASLLWNKCYSQFKYYVTLSWGFCMSYQYINSIQFIHDRKMHTYTLSLPIPFFHHKKSLLVSFMLNCKPPRPLLFRRRLVSCFAHFLNNLDLHSWCLLQMCLLLVYIHIY